MISCFPWCWNVVKKLPMRVRSLLTPVASQIIQFQQVSVPVHRVNPGIQSKQVVEQKVARASLAGSQTEAKPDSISTVFSEMAHNEKVRADSTSLNPLGQRCLINHPLRHRLPRPQNPEDSRNSQSRISCHNFQPRRHLSMAESRTSFAPSSK